jgi:quercetin dioxygenase-like cupin family protein
MSRDAWQASAMVPESRLEPTDHGLVPKGDGWFVLNAREARWLHAPGRSAICEFEGYLEDEQDFLQFGINLSVLQPGESMGMYHWEADQEDFLVLAGEALLIVEGEERPLRQWDLVHCPSGTEHIIVGAGDGALPRARGRRPRALKQTGVGRLHRRRGRAAPRRER